MIDLRHEAGNVIDGHIPEPRTAWGGAIGGLASDTEGFFCIDGTGLAVPAVSETCSRLWVVRSEQLDPVDSESPPDTSQTHHHTLAVMVLLLRRSPPPPPPVLHC